MTEILLFMFPFLHLSVSPVFPASQKKLLSHTLTQGESPLGNTYVADSNFNSLISQFRFESHCDVSQMLGDDFLFAE